MPSIPMHDETSTASFSVMESKPYASVNNPLSSSHRVEFASSHIVNIFDKVDDDVKHEIWYTIEEYDIIKARNSLIVKMMKTGNFDESEDHSFRGLEHKLKDGYKRRRANKFNGLNSVLEEQDRQYARNIKDESLIADMYKRVTQNSRESSFLLGLKDSEQSCSYRQTQKSQFMNRQTLSQERLIRVSSSPRDTEEYESEIEAESIHLTKKKKSKFKKFFGLGSSSKGKVEIKSASHTPATRRMQRRASM